eukprot:TRINITY_DN9022_c0_g1::TRINITY_DN9022_c0_g1_i1::g.18231::m.18231 TRINITY_DN9022_c0_g1::TRINITY_DN9022_c0_g1_i1::g.18231  ORF type:complete len:376 (+),score=68.00,TPR_12/PF13424.1/0.066,TPR_12/PF13424.1/0.088,TPR_12/PF13424.1/0.00049,TPR_12/PF13424.1/1.3e-06,TPR_12/PF13424.1/4.6,TPR_19/PF14559.1/5.9e+03,TPR_19/PF14559.1/0.00085,TPR_19/PF14559.1/0.32,TPR_19/PF14559.1/0.89,TPR_19/PF14559.1/33,TPR_19/PF14559.1/4.9e+02,TPR_11/PF13414.1/0.00063,TPR_11/PF13414.1/12,TPR_11/PF13414.1/46,TPR_11/PF13414.1/
MKFIRLFSTKQAKELVSQLPEVKEAREAIRKRQYDNSESLLRRAIEITSQFDVACANEVRLQLAAVYFETGQSRKELVTLQESLRNTNNVDDSLRISNRLAVALIRVGDLASAESTLSKSLEKSTNETSGLISETRLHQGVVQALRHDNPETQLSDQTRAIFENVSKQAPMKSSILGHALLFRGLCELTGKDKTSAQQAIEVLKQSIDVLQPLEGSASGATSAALMHMGRAQGVAGDMDAAEASLADALRLAKEKFGEDSERVAEPLLVLARLYHGRGDGVSAEGMFRAALSRLDRASAHLAMKAPLQATVMECYADLLEHMQWNNKPRVREAQLFLDKASTLRSSFPHVNALSKGYPRFPLDTWYYYTYALRDD